MMGTPRLGLNELALVASMMSRQLWTKFAQVTPQLEKLTPGFIMTWGMTIVAPAIPLTVITLALHLQEI